jgi:LPS O-antigen subunit length determinant protein (WzzB/FepE family)
MENGPTSHSDEIDISQLIKAIWSTRYTVSICCAIFVAFFVALVVFKNLALQRN